MAENDAQRSAIMYGIGALARHFRNRPDVYVSGDLLIYYEEGNPRASIAPDVFVVFGVEKRQRPNYKLWEERRAPAFVLEVASPSTGRADYTTKRDDYADFGVGEYWRFDYSGGRYHDAPLAGDRLVQGGYEPIPVSEDRSGKLFGMSSGYSEVLGLYLCWDEGNLRFYDPNTDEFLMDPQQLETALAEAQAARDAALERIRQLEAESGR